MTMHRDSEVGRHGPIATTALYMEVADRLRRRIYGHELRPGEPIDERALCEELGISRTPLREALKVLNAEGLVDLVPRRGCFVRQLAPEELRDLFPVMAVLEGLCARQAAERLSPSDLHGLEAMHERLETLAAAGQVDEYYEENFQFHGAVQQLSGNRWLQRTVGELRRILRLARHHQLTLPGRLRSSLEEHRRIMEALRRGDADAAEHAMREHLTEQRFALQRLSAMDREDADVASTNTQNTKAGGVER